MIKITRKIGLTIVIGLLAFTTFAQQPPPPPGGGHGQNGNQNGGNAPIGSGLFILLSLGVAYGSKKVYLLKKSENE